MANKPSLKALEKAFPGKGKELRAILTSDDAVWNNHAVIAWASQCYNAPSYMEARLCALDNVLEGYGVEYQAKGNNAKSPRFWYINMCDTYTTTILRINGHYRIGCWGDIVERGNYD